MNTKRKVHPAPKEGTISREESKRVVKHIGQVDELHAKVKELDTITEEQDKAQGALHSKNVTLQTQLSECQAEGDELRELIYSISKVLYSNGEPYDNGERCWGRMREIANEQ